MVEKVNPGFHVEKIKTKMALRIVQNGLITLTDCRVPGADRFAERPHLQRHREGSADDPRRGGVVRRRLSDGRL